MSITPRLGRKSKRIFLDLSVALLILAAFVGYVSLTPVSQNAQAYCYLDCYPSSSYSYSSTTATTTGTGTGPWSAPMPTKVPKGIFAYVPITLVNTQSVATTRGYDQLLVINSSKFHPYEGAGLQNVEFFTKTGGGIPSWLESGNSNTSTASFYWLRINSPIPALSNVTIYMGFADLHTNLFAIHRVGEAPQLTPVYGVNDNGAKVFALYDDFHVGTMSPLWLANLTAGGSFVRNNSLTVNFGTAPGYFAFKPKQTTGRVFEAGITSFRDGDNLGFLSTAPTPVLRNSGNGLPDWAGSYVRSSCNAVFPDQINRSGEANHCGSVDGLFYNGTAGVRGLYSVGILPTMASYDAINYSFGGTTQPIAVDTATFRARAGFTGENTSLTATWARVRVAPPNAVMPSPVFDNVHVELFIANGAHISTNGQFFVPSNITITVGATVTWTNLDSVFHTVSSDSPLFDSGLLASKSTFSFTFTSAGAVTYHCNIHPWMHGEVVVVPA